MDLSEKTPHEIVITFESYLIGFSKYWCGHSKLCVALFKVLCIIPGARGNTAAKFSNSKVVLKQHF